MRRVYKIGAVFALICGSALAETWTGLLIDIACADRKKNTACIPTPSTESFGLKTIAKTFRLDSAGNKKAAEALRHNGDNANREKDPNAQTEGVTATVTGTIAGDQIRVDSIQLY